MVSSKAVEKNNDFVELLALELKVVLCIIRIILIILKLILYLGSNHDNCCGVCVHVCLCMILGTTATTSTEDRTNFSRPISLSLFNSNIYIFK